MVKPILTFLAVLSIVLFLSMPGLWCLAGLIGQENIVITGHNQAIERAALENEMMPD